MRKDKSYCQRTFGKITIKVTKSGVIKIIGQSYHIKGLIYPNNIKDFKKGKINPVTGHPIQVIGLDNDITSQRPINCLYQKIRDGHFDHLIKED